MEFSGLVMNGEKFGTMDHLSSAKRVDLTTLCHDYPMNVLLDQFESKIEYRRIVELMVET